MLMLVTEFILAKMFLLSLSVSLLNFGRNISETGLLLNDPYKVIQTRPTSIRLCLALVTDVIVLCVFSLLLFFHGCVTYFITISGNVGGEKRYQ